MSEQLIAATATAQERLDSFEDAKREQNAKQYTEVAYGDAGATDCSENAKSRLEEQVAYEAYMEKFSTDERDSLDRHVAAVDAGDVKPKDDARLLRITMLQEDIARMEADGNGEKIADEKTGKTVLEYRKERLAELHEEYGKGIIHEKVAAKTGEIATIPAAATPTEAVAPESEATDNQTAATVEVIADDKPKIVQIEKTVRSNFDDILLSPEQKQNRHDYMVKIWQNAPNNERHRMLQFYFGEERYKYIDHEKVDKLKDPAEIIRIVTSAFDKGYELPPLSYKTVDQPKKQPMPVSNVYLPGVAPPPTQEGLKTEGERILGVIKNIVAAEDETGSKEVETDESEFVDDNKSGIRKFFNRIKSGYENGISRKTKLKIALGTIAVIGTGIGAYYLLKDPSVAVSASETLADKLKISGGAGEVIKGWSVNSGDGVKSLLEAHGISPSKINFEDMRRLQEQFPKELYASVDGARILMPSDGKISNELSTALEALRNK